MNRRHPLQADASRERGVVRHEWGLCAMSCAGRGFAPGFEQKIAKIAKED